MIFKKNGFSISLILIVSLLCSSCQKGNSISVGTDFGPLEVSVSIDGSGSVAFVYGFTPKARLSLGPVALKFAIQRTIELTKSKPYYLFILTQDSSGNVMRRDFEIGRKFRVVFNSQDRVREIVGDNDSVIVAVEQNTASTNSFSIDGTWRVTWKNGTNAAVLRINGGVGTAETTYYDSGQNIVRLSQDVRVISQAQGMVAVCSNPVNYDTKESLTNYTPDRFLFRLVGNNSVQVWTMDEVNTKQWGQVTVNSYTR